MDKRQYTYAEAEQYILSVPKFTQKNEQTRTKQFYERLGKPCGNTKIIHVAGTNGKGSVCAYLNAMLTEAGYTVGMFTSPHLVTMRERFRVGGKMVSESKFAASFSDVMEEVRQWNKTEEFYHPTFFELLFFMGMQLFESSSLDYVILETGLGGRLDATNVIEHPVATVITKIALDHMEYLGDTLEKIAGEKAGILKQGTPLIFLDTTPEVTSVLTNRAKDFGCAVYGVSCQNYTILQIKNKSIDFFTESKYYRSMRLTLSTCALYQLTNVVTAIMTMTVIGVQQQMSEEQIRRAVAGTVWEGRMEEIMPDVILDGAHNEDGMEAFMHTVRASKGYRNQLLFAVVKDKNYAEMIRILMKDHLFDRITITQISGDRAVPATVLREIFEQYTDTEIVIEENISAAFADALAHKKKQDRLYIVGSLYLVGQIKKEELK
ncbi:MAG: folylpolyglutamate synthase/dihydrofolate synthase family protein [Lachnospiraceae bacterium]